MKNGCISIKWRKPKCYITEWLSWCSHRQIVLPPPLVFRPHTLHFLFGHLFSWSSSTSRSTATILLCWWNLFLLFLVHSGGNCRTMEWVLPARSSHGMISLFCLLSAFVWTAAGGPSWWSRALLPPRLYKLSGRSEVWINSRDPWTEQDNLKSERKEITSHVFKHSHSHCRFTLFLVSSPPTELSSLPLFACAGFKRFVIFFIHILLEIKRFRFL